MYLLYYADSKLSLITVKRISSAKIEIHENPLSRGARCPGNIVINISVLFVDMIDTSITLQPPRSLSCLTRSPDQTLSAAPYAYATP